MSVDAANEDDHGDTPVAIALFTSGVEASLPAAVLQSHGIDAQVIGDTVSDSLNVGLAVRKVELVVPSRQAERARQLLKELADARPPRSADWQCSGCGEINGAEFDACWSCGKAWSVDDDSEHVPESAIMTSPSSAGAGLALPDIDPNPYAAPAIAAIVSSPDHDAAELAIRRTRNGMLLSLFFPPLVLVVLFEAANALTKASGGELPSSPQQRRRLLIWSFAGILELAVFAVLFVCLMG